MATSGRQGIVSVSGVEEEQSAWQQAVFGQTPRGTGSEPLEIGAKFRRGWAGDQSQFLLLNTLK